MAKDEINGTPSVECTKSQKGTLTNSKNCGVQASKWLNSAMAMPLAPRHLEKGSIF